MKKILIAVAITLLLGAGAYAALRRGSTADTTSQAPTATPVAAEEQLVAEAQVVPAHSAALRVPNGGIVAELLGAEGDQVQAGQVLVRLDQARAAATVAQAEAQLAQAQAAFDRLHAGATPEEIALA